jgi:hypothetical protein
MSRPLASLDDWRHALEEKWTEVGAKGAVVCCGNGAGKWVQVWGADTVHRVRYTRRFTNSNKQYIRQGLLPPVRHRSHLLHGVLE